MTEDDPFEELEDLTFDDEEEIDDAVDELFSEVDVESVDEEAIWDAVAAGDGATAARNGEVAVEGDAAVEDDDGVGSIVPKASYCQKCEHFSKPPEVGCRNPGTEIVEQVDLDHFRVRDCPVVERRESATRNIEDR